MVSQYRINGANTTDVLCLAVFFSFLHPWHRTFLVFSESEPAFHARLPQKRNIIVWCSRLRSCADFVYCSLSFLFLHSFFIPYGWPEQAGCKLQSFRAAVNLPRRATLHSRHGLSRTMLAVPHAASPVVMPCGRLKPVASQGL